MPETSRIEFETHFPEKEAEHRKLHVLEKIVDPSLIFVTF